MTESIEPGGAHVARTVLRSCDATTGFVTLVTLGRQEDTAAGATVIMSADDDHGAALTENDALWVRLAWGAAGDLGVAYAEHARVFTARKAWDGIRISYRASGPIQLPPVP